MSAGAQAPAASADSIVRAVPQGLFVAGAWVGRSDRASIDVIDPATAGIIATVPSATVTDGLAAVTAAHDALPGWAARPPRERSEILRHAYELMTERAEQLARLYRAGKRQDTRGRTR